MEWEHWVSLGASFLSNTLAAFAGGGGSIILLSSLLLLLPSTSYLSILAITKSSAAILTASSGFLHSDKQIMDWGMIFTLIFPGLLGVGLSTYLIQYKIDEGLVIQAIPFLLLGVVLYLLFNKDLGVKGERRAAFTHAEYAEAALFSFLISIVNGMSAGLGPLFIAYFVIRFNTSFIQTMAYLMISGTIINVLQASYLLWTVDVNLVLLLLVIVGSLTGSVLGTKLQYKMGNRFVKPAALLMMTVIGVGLLIN